MTEIIIATSNKGKVKEFERITECSMLKAQRKNLIFRTIDEVYAGDFDPEETGSTFQENAVIKAKAAAELISQQTLNIEPSASSYILADDSGIEIFALNGRPGIYSARYLKAHGIEGILKELADNPNRQARFVCHLTLVNLRGDVVFETENYWTGNITHEARGTKGFGYDPIVVPDEYTSSNLTVAELDDEIKSKLSHRAQSLIKVWGFLAAHHD